MTDTSKPDQSNQAALPGLQVGAYKTLTIDYELYAQYLESTDLSDDQKREFLDTLWNIIVNFVDLGFGVHPLQQVTPSHDDISACEQNTIPLEYLTSDSGNMVDLDTTQKTNFKQAADGEHLPCSQKSKQPERKDHDSRNGEF